MCYGIEVWKAIDNGSFGSPIVKDGKTIDKLDNDWNDLDSKKVQNYWKALKMLENTRNEGLNCALPFLKII